MLPKQPNLISNALKCVGVWRAYDALPNPLIGRENPSHYKFLATPLMNKFPHLDENIRQNDATVDQSTNMADDMRRKFLGETYTYTKLKGALCASDRLI